MRGVGLWTTWWKQTANVEKRRTFYVESNLRALQKPLTQRRGNKVGNHRFAEIRVVWGTGASEAEGRRRDPQLRPFETSHYSARHHVGLLPLTRLAIHDVPDSRQSPGQSGSRQSPDDFGDSLPYLVTHDCCLKV